jgi:hypothetical protein
VAQGVELGEARRESCGQENIRRNLRLLSRVGKRVSPSFEQTAVNRKEQKFVGNFFTGGFNMKEFTEF